MNTSLIALAVIFPTFFLIWLFIRDRNRIARQLKYNWQPLFDRIDELILVLDQTGTILKANHAAEKQLGYTPSELIGMNVLMLHPEERRAETVAVVAEMAANTKDYCSIPILTKDGTIIPMETRVTHGEWDGKPVMIGVSRNVSERQKNEKELLQYKTQLEEMVHKRTAALEKSRRRFMQLADNINEIFSLIELDTLKFTFFNKAAVRLFGYDPLDNLPTTLNTLPFFLPDNVAPRLDMIIQGLKEGRELTLEFRIRRQNDGAIRWFRATAKPVREESGAIRSMAVIAMDVTENKQAAEQERLRREQLLQADKMASLGVLVSGMAHEINNPNNLIMLNADILSASLKDMISALDAWAAVHPDFTLNRLPYAQMRPELPVLFTGITGGAKRISNIVHTLKRFTQIDEGRTDQQVSVHEVIEAAVSIMRNFIIQHTHAFSIVCPDNLGHLRGNFQQIEQVIINLLSNACQALRNPSESIILSAERTVSDRIRITITDQGVGIPKDNLNKIIQPFFTTRRDLGGTGLGLSVSYSIIEFHHGRLYFESEEGKGTRAIIELPAI